MRDPPDVQRFQMSLTSNGLGQSSPLDHLLATMEQQTATYERLLALREEFLPEHRRARALPSFEEALASMFGDQADNVYRVIEDASEGTIGSGVVCPHAIPTFSDAGGHIKFPYDDKHFVFKIAPKELQWTELMVAAWLKNSPMEGFVANPLSDTPITLSDGLSGVLWKNLRHEPDPDEQHMTQVAQAMAKEQDPQMLLSDPVFRRMYVVALLHTSLDPLKAEPMMKQGGLIPYFPFSKIEEDLLGHDNTHLERHGEEVGELAPTYQLAEILLSQLQEDEVCIHGDLAPKNFVGDCPVDFSFASVASARRDIVWPLVKPGLVKGKSLRQAERTIEALVQHATQMYTSARGHLAKESGGSYASPEDFSFKLTLELFTAALRYGARRHYGLRFGVQSPIEPYLKIAQATESVLKSRHKKLLKNYDPN